MTSPAKTLYDCAKCDGRGTIRAFAHVHGGACFACEGTGKVELPTITDADARQITVSNLYASADAALESEQLGNSELAKARLSRMVPDLFRVGTETAREVLAHVAAGAWHDGGRMDSGQVDPRTASKMSVWLVAQGRAQAAQK